MPSWNSACVPTTSRTSPEAIASSALRRVARRLRAGHAAPPGDCSGWNHSQKLRQCCSASSSVGAISAACSPLPAARAAAAAATTVLPQPTSPWSSRTIGCVAAQVGIRLRASARVCAPVSGNGSDCDEARRELLAIVERPRGFGARRALEQPQAQLVREQLFEGEPPLRGVPAGGELVELRLARRVDARSRSASLQRRAGRAARAPAAESSRARRRDSSSRSA